MQRLILGRKIAAVAFVQVGLLACGALLWAQATGSADSSAAHAGSQSGGAAQQTTGAAPQQDTQNPFPTDTSNVPIIPTGNSPVLFGEGGDTSRIPLPSDDVDPVRTPEQVRAAAEGGDAGSSSSLAGIGDLLRPPSDETKPGRHGNRDEELAPEHHETAAEDEEVGKYYLDNHDWKAALSRYQSALVLDPYNPDVYWGLAEAERHLGQYAEARANYEKVMEYDPDSHHAKEAKKILMKDPQIANAKPTAAAASSGH